jgi:carbon-monoxide dehydrogenase small subunit
MDIVVTVNGRAYEENVPVRLTLADYLRETLGLTGTHLGCEHGVCGCCTVLLDGQTARSCLMFAVQADGAEVTTIEGLASEDGELSEVQLGFHERHGLQCGYCTPGMLLTVTELLSESLDQTEESIRERISGVVCRCTGYQSIVESTRRAMELMKSEPLRAWGDIPHGRTGARVGHRH